MIDLRTQIGGVTFDNPVWVGSATPTWDSKRVNASFQSGAAAVVPKTFCSEASWRKHPRTGRMFFKKIGKTNIGMLNIESFSTINIDDWIEHELDRIKKGNDKLIVSVLAMPDKKDTAEMVKKVTETGRPDMIELNGSCPMHTTFSDENMAEMIYTEVENALASTHLPMTVKLSPNVSSLLSPAKAAREAGASGVVISNSLKSFGGVDIHTGEPKIRTYSGYSGPAIKPVVQMHVSEFAQHVDIPICAVGGISTWEDIIEYIMLGASAVQIVSHVMWHGYGIIGTMLEKVRHFMAQAGYEKIEDFRGIALPKIVSMDELVGEAPKFAKIDYDKCIDCKKCVKVCFYGAIQDAESGVAVNTKKCDGCSMCVQVCPTQAISLNY